MKQKFARRGAAVAAAVGAVAVGLSSLGAGAAAAGPLPGGTVNKTFANGAGVTIQLYDEFVNVQRAVSNVPTSREAWVSGKVRVTTRGGAEGGAITAGYLVGCQLNFGANAGAGAGGKTELTDGKLFDGAGEWTGLERSNPNATLSADVTGGFTLGPGQAAFVPVINTGGANSFNFTSGTGGVAYSQERFTVNGCAGHAEAKALIQVQVSTDDFKGNVSLWGKPFSLG